MQFKSFTAASRKRNIIPFGMFPASEDLSWIADNPPNYPVVTVVYSSTPVFDATLGQYQQITLTGDASPEFLYNDGPIAPAGTMLTIRWVMSGGPWTITWPVNLSIFPMFQLGDEVTVTNLWSNGVTWEFRTPASQNPA